MKTVKTLVKAGVKHFKPEKKNQERFFFDEKSKKFVYVKYVKEGLAKYWKSQTFTQRQLEKQLTK